MVYFTLFFAIFEMVNPQFSGLGHVLFLAIMLWATILYYWVSNKFHALHQGMGVLLFSILVLLAVVALLIHSAVAVVSVFVFKGKNESFRNHYFITADKWCMKVGEFFQSV